VLGRVREDAGKGFFERSDDEKSDTDSGVTELYSFPHYSAAAARNVSPLWKTVESILEGHSPDSYPGDGHSNKTEG
jgi:hypothetical protein